jgi:hypothetical protein
VLYLDSVTTIQGVTLYRDYSFPNRVYYQPRHPRLAREAGEPLFQLLIYRRDITDNPAFKEGDRLGGGFLTMTVDLSVPESVLTAIRSELSGQGGQEVELTPVPFEQGSVRVTALGTSSVAAAEGDQARAAGERFVERILGSVKPSLYGDNRAVFSIELSHEGAQLMRASLQDAGASQVAVVYDLDYRGLMPAYQAKIKIQFRQSYQYLRNRFTMNTLFFKTDLDAELEKLTKEGSIQITEVDFSGMEPAAAAQARDKLNTLAKELATWTFFKPSLTPGTVLAVDRGQLVAADPTAAAQQVAAGFSQPLEAVASSRGGVAGTVGPRLQGQSGDERGARAGGRSLPTGESTPGEGAAPAAGERPLTAVERWNQAGRPQAAFMLRSLTQEEQQDIEYDLFQVSATKRSIAPQGQIRLAAGDAQLAGRIQEVDLNSPFFERISGTVTTSADLKAAGVSSMIVKIRYGVRDDGTAPKDSAEFVLTEAGKKESYSFFSDRRLSIEFEYQIVVNYQAGFAIGDPATQATSPWKRTTTRNLDIDPAEVSAVFSVGLTAAQVDWNTLSAIECVLQYEDTSPGLVSQASVVLTQPKAEASFHIRPRDPQRRSYSLKANYMYKTGEAFPVEQSGTGARTFVLNQPAQLSVPITVVSSDPLKRFSKIAAELAYPPPGGPEQQKLLTFAANGETQTWTISRSSPTEKPKYQYRTTLFAVNGTQARIDWQPSSDQLLVVGEKFEHVLEVSVRVLVPDFRAAGLLGAKLRLQYRDAAEHADDDKEMVFMTPTPEPFRWVVPKKPGGGENYEYTVTWINADGTQKVVGPRTTADEELILHPLL